MLNSWYKATLKSHVWWDWTSFSCEFINMNPVTLVTHVDVGLWKLRTRSPYYQGFIVVFFFLLWQRVTSLKSIHPTRPSSGWHQDKPPTPIAQDAEARWDIIPLACSGSTSGSLPTLMRPANRRTETQKAELCFISVFNRNSGGF